MCINAAPGYTCQCDDGYHLVDKVCVDSDECAQDQHPCGLGECINTAGSYDCLCPEGFIFQDKVCQDINECINNNSSRICGPHGDCLNLEGGFECHCHDGFEIASLSTDQQCVDIDECLQPEHQPCGHGSTCLNLIGSYECQCPLGFVLSNANHCEDVDECSEGNGGCEMICENVPGSFRCACESGFDLGADGVSCQETDECAVNNGGCQELCNNTYGGYFCSCSAGFEVSGADKRQCQDIDECLLENGGCSDTCINRPGSFSCACPEGYRLRPDDRTCKLASEEKKQNCDSHQRPVHGYLKCTARKKKGQFPVGTRCRLKCRRGYEYQPLSGPFKTSCQRDGQWSQLGSCVAKLCDPLPVLENGTVDPPNCTTQRQAGGSQCSFNCLAGYQLQGRRSVTCSRRNGQWKDEMPTCAQMNNVPKPFIMCPADITKPLSGHSSSAYVMIPQPKTNVDWGRYVDADPSWAKQLEGEMTRGNS